METFRLLSRGGVKFNKKRFKTDMDLFESSTTNSSSKTATTDSSQTTLPAELDFFKYAEGGNPKRRKSDGANDASMAASASSENERPKKKAKLGDEPQAGSSKQPHRVTLKGVRPPKCTETFDDAASRYEISSRILQNLSANGFRAPTAIQSYGLPVLLEKRDLAAISPTGTGKTLSYLIPIMALLNSPISSLGPDAGQGVRALVVAPTRELAHQIHNECLKLAEGRKWRIVLFSKATASTLADKVVRNKIDVIVSTPLRLVASLQNGSLELDNVRHLVLDEADRLLDSEFLEQTKEIIAACSHNDLQKAVFSATLPAGAEQIAMSNLRDPIRIVVGLKDTPLPLISQSLTYVADDASKLPTLLQYFAHPYTPPIVIFTSTQPRASSLAEQLVLNNIANVDCLHAGMTKKEREDTVSRMRRGECWIMISTEVMARGMDFKGVRSVINYDFPTSVQSYIHRIGRTGRAGREGAAVTYFTNDDAPYLKSIANVIMQSGSTVPEWILKLPKPSKMKRKKMGKVSRDDTVTKDGRIGRNQARRQKDMVQGSRRRMQRSIKSVAAERGNETASDAE